MGGSKGFEIRRQATLCVYVCAIASLLFVVCGCGEQLNRMEENQVKLQAMVAANAREIATLSSQVHTGTAKLGEGIQNLDTQGQGIAAGVQTVQTDQKQLRETVVAGHQNLDQKIDAKATALQEGQQSLQARVTNVQEVTGRTASDLTALAQHQAGLRETVQTNQRELNNHMGVVLSNQQGIQTGLTRLHEADAGLAQSITSVAGKQDTMSAAMQDNNTQTTERLTTIAAAQTATQNSVNGNHEQVAGRLAGLAESQQRLQTGVETLDGKVARMSEDTTGAASALQQAISVNHDKVTSQMAELAANHQKLQTGLDALNGKADKAAADSEVAASSLQETLRVSREVVTGQMAASIENQQAIQTSVQDLHGKTDGLTAGLAAVSAEQTTAKETSRTHHDEIITAMAGLSEGHQSLRSGIDQVNGKADQIVGGLASAASDQKALQENTQANHEAVIGRLGDLSKGQTDLRAGLNTLNQKADATTSELSAAAQRHNALQQTVTAGNEALAAHATTVAESHRNLDAAVADLGARTQQVSTDLTTMASAQSSFRQQQLNHNEAITTRTTALAEGQQALRGQVDLLAATTSQTALSMLTLNNGQATFQQAMQAGMNGLHERADQTASSVKGMIELNSAMNQAITAQAVAMTENQQTMKADIVRMAGVVDRAYADLTAVSLAQDTLQSTLAGRSDDISGRMARLDDNQKELAESLNILTATAGQTALDVMGLATGHADLNRTIHAGNDAVIARAATLADNQKTLGSQLDVVTETTSQTAADVIAVSDRQNALAGAVQDYSNSTHGQMAKLAESQQRANSGLDVLTAKADQTAANVTAVGERQAEFARAVQSHSDSSDSQMAKLAENQQRAQSGLDVLTSTAEQTTKDLVAVTSRQDTLAQAIQSHDESVSGRFVRLDENQQKTQGSIDAVATTAGQAVRDIAGLNETQARSEQTAQAGRAEVTAKLAEIAQGQQSWLERFDAAQTRIQAMADSIATLDQQLGKLQGVLQTGTQATTTALDANGQQRQQFEAKIAQDVQAMIDAISQLRQTQAQLQEQMSQVQKSTQSQTDTLKTTIEQLKAAPAQQPPVEVKVSDSAKPAEPAVVQTGE